MTMEHAAEILAELKHLSGLIEALPTAIAAASAVRLCPLAKKDRQLLNDVLPKLGDSLGPRGRVFSAADAIEFLSQQHPETTAQLLRGVGEGHPARRLGRLLARAAGHDIGGLVVERVKGDRLGVTWAIKNGIERRTDTAKPAAVLARRTGVA
jgi:hypothetical protein